MAQTEFVIEKELRELGFERIVGIDEVGRGPLAGPVVAVACLLPYPSPFVGIGDSKTFSEKRRQELYQHLISHRGVEYGVGVVESYEIDATNIHQAVLESMRRAFTALDRQADFLLVDGLFIPECIIPAAPVVQGDACVEAIGAASILAKEIRDQMMKGYHELFPVYGFHLHKGYPTKMHIEALEAYGPCPIHRMSFHRVA